MTAPEVLSSIELPKKLFLGTVTPILCSLLNFTKIALVEAEVRLGWPRDTLVTPLERAPTHVSSHLSAAVSSLDFQGEVESGVWW